MMIWLDFLQVEPDHQNQHVEAKEHRKKSSHLEMRLFFVLIWLLLLLALPITQKDMLKSSVFLSRAPLRKVSKLGSHSQSNCLILLRAKFSVCQQRSSMGMLVFVRLTSCYAGACLGHVTQHDRQRVA